MNLARFHRMFSVVLISTGACSPHAGAQDPAMVSRNWKSAPSTTYTNPALTGSELYLNIDVAKDGSFRGTWGQYICNAYSGAYGTSIYSCNQVGSHRVSGRFHQDRQGIIDLERLGRSTFTWTAGAEQLTIDLPKDWQGKEAILYQARLTRDGRREPVTSPTSPREAPLLSANALYREFRKDARAALARHGGKVQALEGLRGALIELSDGGAAIHIADGFTRRALVLNFADLKEVDGIAEGEQFRFRCTVSSFEYGYVHLDRCALVR